MPSHSILRVVPCEILTRLCVIDGGKIEEKLKTSTGVSVGTWKEISILEYLLVENTNKKLIRNSDLRTELQNTRTLL